MVKFLISNKEQIPMKYTNCHIPNNLIFRKAINTELNVEAIKFKLKLKTNICEKEPDSLYLLPKTNPNNSGPKSRIIIISTKQLLRAHKKHLKYHF